MYMATPEEDAIEILSSYTENTSVFNVSPRTECDPDERFIETPIQITSFVIHHPPVQKPGKTKHQKWVSRIVFATSMTLLSMSLILVAVSFTMTQHIDELARKSNPHYNTGSKNKAPGSGVVFDRRKPTVLVTVTTPKTINSTQNSDRANRTVGGST